MNEHLAANFVASATPQLRSRRRALSKLLAILVVEFLLPIDAAAIDGRVPVTGTCPHALESFDRLLVSFLKEKGVPGASLAVTRDERLVVARGYGWADKERKEPVRPDSLFRIASLSKPITAVAVLQLAERGQLDLETKAIDLLCPSTESGGRAPSDPRWHRITILHLLHHTGGFDREASFDPMFRSREIARKAGKPPPAMPDDIIDFMLDRSLDFEPGTRYAYSNFGYSLLGRIIEKCSGKDYETYVCENVLAPLDIHRMRIGRTLPEGRAPGEVKYYHYRSGNAPSVMADGAGVVPRPYGAWCLEAMDAHGGWIASAIDLARFAVAFHRPEDCDVLQPASIELMFRRPSGGVWRDERGKPSDAYYACGWMVRPKGPGGASRNTWHAGAFDGSAALLVRRHDGLGWVVLFNTSRGPEGERLSSEIDPLLHRAAAEVETWPAIDLFEDYR